MRQVLKVCVFGPESTGKSTLAANLARHYQTYFVPEYAKTLLDQQGRDLTIDDMSRIATGQMLSEDTMIEKAHEILFCDTDLITTTIWSEWLFGTCPDWIKVEADRRSYDLYLLTDVDVPWVNDTHRYLPDDRNNFLARCVQELDKRMINYVKITGSWDERFNIACNAVNSLLLRHS